MVEPVRTLPARAARRVAEPWRTGRRGTAAEVGRWLGLGLAVGAFALGVGLAAYGAFRRGP